MASITDFIEIGKQLGYEGEKLQKFVEEERKQAKEKDDLAKEERRLEREQAKEKDDLAREERRLEREAEKLRQEAEKFKLEKESEKLKLEKEAEKLKLEAEKLKLELEAENKNAERQHQLEMTKLTANGDSKKNSGGNTPDIMSKIPKLAPFQPSKGDQMDAYLFRFEMLVKSYKWSAEIKFIALSNLLSGEALKVLQTLTESQQTYDHLKAALLKRFMCTEHGYSLKFREVVPMPTEDISAFISRLETLFDRWVELAGVGSEFNKLRDLMLRDQIFRSLHKDLATFMKERSPKSVEEVREIGEKYTVAYPQRSIAKEESVMGNVAVKAETQRSRPLTSNDRGRSGQRRSHSSGFYYDKSNSFEKNRPYDNYAYRSNYGRGYNARGGSFRRFDARRGASNYRRPYRDSTPHYSNHLANASTLVSSKHAIGTDHALKYFDGKVNGITCKTIRDTGCSTVGIKESLLKPSDFTGQYQTCVMFDGSKVSFRTAYAHIETPFYTGRVLALCLKNPYIDLIVGNIPDIDDTP